MAEVLPPPCEDMLSERDRNAWCGDTDPTGRYVCRRVRDHALDFHAARNPAGGVHQWPVQHRVEGAASASGAVDVSALAEACEAYTAAYLGREEEISPELVDGIRAALGVPAELAELQESRLAWAIEADRLDAELAGRDAPDPAHGDLRQRIITALSEQVSEFISPNPFGGYDPHYGELTDIALTVVQPELTRHAAEITRLRATNESLLAMLERMESQHVTFHGPDGEEYHPDWCRECRVDKVRAELDDLTRQRDDWWDQRAAERDALSRMVRGMARRASGQRRAKERLAMWAEGRRPAIPADAVDLLVHAAESCPPGPDHADRLTRSYRRFFRAWGLDQPASSVGSDTTPAQSVDAVIERMNQFVGKRVHMEMSPDADDGALFGNGLAGVVAKVHTNVWVYVDHGPGMCALAEGFKIREIPAASFWRGHHGGAR